MSGRNLWLEGRRAFSNRSEVCGRCLATSNATLTPSTQPTRLNRSYSSLRQGDSTAFVTHSHQERISHSAATLPSRRRLSTSSFLARAHRGTTPDHQADQHTIAGEIRRLMSSSAQPVALLLTALPSSIDEVNSTSSHSRANRTTVEIHGATISSLTSLSLSPPLVGFSLRTPSRAANALLGAQQMSNGPTFTLTLLAHADSDADTDAAQHASCSNLAGAYAVPGLEAYSLASDWSHKSPAGLKRPNAADHPLSSAKLLPSSAFASSGRSNTPIPYLAHALGAFSCSLEARIRLASLTSHSSNECPNLLSKSLSAPYSPRKLRLDTTLAVPSEQDETLAESVEAQETGKSDTAGKESQESWLLIARVWDVHGSDSTARQEADDAKPLVWWNKHFTTVQK